VICAGTARAQVLAGTRFTDPATLIQNKSVQEHLDLTPDQVQKVFNVPILVRQQAEKEIEALKKIENAAEREAKKQALKKHTIAAGTKALQEVLKPEQLKRLQQIAMQMNDFQAFTVAEVKEKLKLTPDQQIKLKTIADDGTKAMRDIMVAGKAQGGGDFEKMWDKTRPARNKALANAVAVLTPDQKHIWQDMVGESFEFSLKRPGKTKIPQEGAPAPATAAQKADPDWVARRVQEWAPSAREKSFDRIGWQTELREATRLARWHNRGVFIFVVDGTLGTGRC
jgi:hypothetical protein